MFDPGAPIAAQNLGRLAGIEREGMARHGATVVRNRALGGRSQDCERLISEGHARATAKSRDDSLMLPSPDEYWAMLDGAAAGRYAFPAINVTS